MVMWTLWTQVFGPLWKSIGTLRNYDGDCKENVKKAIGLMSKTATLRVHYAFLYISLLSLHNYDVKLNDQILSLLENGNGEAMNSTISVWTRARSLLFSSNQNSLLLSNRANWDNSEKGCEVYFSAMFSWSSPLSDRKVPIEWPRGEGWKPVRWK